MQMAFTMDKEIVIILRKTASFFSLHFYVRVLRFHRIHAKYSSQNKNCKKLLIYFSFVK